MTDVASPEPEALTDEAILHARRVTELEPNDPFSFTQLSVIYQRCGKIPEAEEAMARAHMLQGRR